MASWFWEEGRDVQGVRPFFWLEFWTKASALEGWGGGRERDEAVGRVIVETTRRRTTRMILRRNIILWEGRGI